LYTCSGKYVEAEIRFKRALDVVVKQLGEHHYKAGTNEISLKFQI
jgi:hypothetical protein